jgi:hypothetical protein
MIFYAILYCSKEFDDVKVIPLLFAININPIVLSHLQSRDWTFYFGSTWIIEEVAWFGGTVQRQLSLRL